MGVVAVPIGVLGAVSVELAFASIVVVVMTVVVVSASWTVTVDTAVPDCISSAPADATEGPSVADALRNENVSTCSSV